MIRGILLLAFFLTVCVVDPALWRGAITAKYFYFSAVTCFALPASAYLLIGRKKGCTLIRTADIAVILFISYIVAQRIFIGGAKDMHCWLFLLMIPLYVIVRAFAENSNGIRILTNVILIAVLAQTSWGILQLLGFLPSYHNAFPITGSLFNPAPYAGFVAAVIPMALGQLHSKKSFLPERVLAGSVLLTSLFVLPFTESRAAWLAALTGGVVVVGIGYADDRHKNILLAFFARGRWRVAAFSMSAVLAIALLYGMYHLKKDSADGRLFIWNVSASIVKEYPVFGIGTGRFAAAYGQVQADYFCSGKGTEAQMMVAGHPDYAFNEYMHVAVELGLAGLFLFLLVAGLCLSPFIKRETGGRQTLAGYYMAALIGMLVFSLFSYPFDVLPLFILFVAFLAVTASQTRPLRRQPGFRWHVAGWLVLLVLTVAVALQVLPRRQSYRGWQEAHLLFRSGAYADALDEYLFLYERLKYEEKFLLEYGRCLSHRHQYEESNRIFEEYLDIGCDPEAYNYMGNNLKALGQYVDAEQVYIRAASITPNRHYPEYLLMKLYRDTGREKEAVDKARHIMAKPVKVNSQVIALIRQEAVKILTTYENKNINE